MSFASIPPLTAKLPSSDPFEIFARRPSLAGTPNDLWGGQQEALKLWVKDRKKKDILISLNTGSGKTMLGVLIAQAMANEKIGKCVYVCSTIDLVLQTEKEARKLGISPTPRYGGEFSNSDFEQGKTFCITTYSAVFNALTTFRRMNVTKFIFDDAHVAEKAIRDAFTLTIDRSTDLELYKVVASLLRPAFAATGQTFKYNEILSLKDQGIALVPPMLAFEVAEQISAEVGKMDLDKRLDLRFPYLYLMDHFKLCAITVSGGRIEIAPPFLPSPVTYPFAQEDMRRVYLSATLQTQAEFARAFGKRPDLVIAPETDAGNGERCILFGQYVPDDDTGTKLGEAIKIQHKLVVACRSYPDAKPWAKLAIVPTRDDFSEELEKFRKASSAALVLVARVDGIDLPDEVCRVMIIDDLPSGYSQVERFQIEYCAMTSLASTKLASRITQVFGRINRGRKDFGVFVLRGKQLNNWLLDAENTALLPELLQKQLLLGDQISYHLIRNKSIPAIMDVLDRVMARDPEWIETYGNRIAEVDLPSDAKASAKEKDVLLTDAALAEVQAMNAAWRGEYIEAAAFLADTADKAAIADPRLAGWHNLWLGWFYQLANDTDAAIAEYARAKSRLGGAILLPRPASPASTGGQKVSLRGSRMFDLLSEHQTSRYDKELLILTNRLLPLASSDNTSTQHEEATRALGEVLGFESSRPDKMHRTGPDVLWIDEEGKSCLLFELKTLQQGNKPLTKKIVGQGHDHLQWVKNQYPGIKVVGIVFVAPSSTCNDDANPSTEMSIGSLAAINQIATELVTTIKSIRSGLPLERLIRVNQFVDDDENCLGGLLARMSHAKLNTGERKGG
jgi:hypothetical protein